MKWYEDGTLLLVAFLLSLVFPVPLLLFSTHSEILATILKFFGAVTVSIFTVIFWMHGLQLLLDKYKD